MIGELDAGNPHVQFDEGTQETCDIATRLRPTLPQPLAILSENKILVWGPIMDLTRSDQHVCNTTF
jgi:hypothetical protein